MAPPCGGSPSPHPQPGGGLLAADETFGVVHGAAKVERVAGVDCFLAHQHIYDNTTDDMKNTMARKHAGPLNIAPQHFKPSPVPRPITILKPTSVWKERDNRRRGRAAEFIGN